MLTGIDVHGGKGNVVWQLVASSGIRFAFVKATEGVSFNDPLYQRNVAAAKAAGLPVGPYHFARPDNNDPVREARHFHSVIAGTGFTAPPALDFETHAPRLRPSAMTQWATEFLDELDRLGHHQRVFYTYPSFWHTDMGDPAPAAVFKPGVLGWWAEYGPTAHYPAGWARWVWQHSSSGHVPGVSGLVDMDLFDGRSFTDSYTPRPAYRPPWGVFRVSDGKQFGAGKLVTRDLVVRIAAELHAAGKWPPFSASTTVGGKPFASGKFWRPGLFTRAIAQRLRAGADVYIDDTIVIKPGRH